MKSLLLASVIIAAVSVGVVVAKPNASPNPRGAYPQESMNTVTAGDQSNKPADLEIVKMIRRELMKDDALSTTAKNIKVIVVNNGVTLKGPVKTAAEREIILKHAYITAPKHKIYNQISVVK